MLRGKGRGLGSDGRSEQVLAEEVGARLAEEETGAEVSGPPSRPAPRQREPAPHPQGVRAGPPRPGRRVPSPTPPLASVRALRFGGGRPVSLRGPRGSGKGSCAVLPGPPSAALTPALGPAPPRSPLPRQVGRPLRLSHRRPGSGGDRPAPAGPLVPSAAWRLLSPARRPETRGAEGGPGWSGSGPGRRPTPPRPAPSAGGPSPSQRRPASRGPT